MRVSVVTKAAGLIDLARAKLHCKLDGEERDAEVTDAIETARALVQADLGVAVGEQTLAFTFDAWCGSGAVPFDIIEVVSVKSGGIAVTYSLVGRTFTVDAAAPIVVVAKVGYSAETLPNPIKSAMLLLIKDLIDNQQSQVEVELHENPAFNNLLALYRERLPI